MKIIENWRFNPQEFNKITHRRIGSGKWAIKSQLPQIEGTPLCFFTGRIQTDTSAPLDRLLYIKTNWATDSIQSPILISPDLSNWIELTDYSRWTQIHTVLQHIGPSQLILLVAIRFVKNLIVIKLQLPFIKRIGRHSAIDRNCTLFAPDARYNTHTSWNSTTSKRRHRF